jgi:hypothetical protein
MKQIKSIQTKILLSLNLMLWLIVSYEIRLADGESIAVSGFPIPWRASSVMGTGDVSVSLPLFLLDFLILLLAIEIIDRLFFRQRTDSGGLSAAAVLLLFLLFPPAIALGARFILGDWSGWVLWPWEGWTGHIESVYLSHGLQLY